MAFENLQIGVKEIAAHRTRSLLTMLGVIFGVAAVIAMSAIGAGAREEALRQIKLLGTNNLRIRKVSLSGQLAIEAMRRSPGGLTREQAYNIQRLMPEQIDRVAISKRIVKRIYAQREVSNARIYAIDANYPHVVGLDVEEGGRLIAAMDLDLSLPVCVIGSETRDMLFPLKGALGQTINIDGVLFEVVGVMAQKRGVSGSSAIVDIGNPNRNVYIPFTTAQARLIGADLRERLDEMAVKIKPGADSEEVATVIERALSIRHGGVRDYEIIIPEALLRQKQRTQRIFSIVLTAVAGISLVVGGIGIMNIMLATVTSRTREIGIRRAIGATRFNILAQFLVEALVISMVGGMVGVGFGFGLSKAITLYADWPVIISPDSVIISFSVAATTGIIFGLFPAIKAAALDPIEALRHE